MDSSNKGAGYIAAIESIVESHKLYVILCGAPLVALATQLQWAQSLDSVIIKSLMTVSVVCFVVAGGFGVYFLDLARHYLAKANLDNDPGGSAESPYMRYAAEMHSHGVGDFTEENLVRIARRFTLALMYLMGLGWLAVVLALLMAIWT